MTRDHDDIAALELAIRRLEQALTATNGTLPPNTRRDLEEVVRTLRDMRDAIRRKG